MKISRMTKGEWGKKVAFFDLEAEGITIKGFSIVDAGSGPFVGRPQQKDKEGKWQDTVYMPKDVQLQVHALAMEEYGDDDGDLPF